MKNIIIIIIGILLLVSFISAETIYSGSTIYYDFTNEVNVIQQITWEVVNNTYNLEGLNITTNLTGAIVSLDPLFKPDNFTIIFTIIGKNIQTDVPVYSSGSSSRTKIIEKETYIEVDNYIDREVPIINNTDIQQFEDDLKKLQDDLDKKNKRVTFLLFWGSILLCLSIYLLIHIFRKKVVKLMIKPKVN